MSTNDDSQTTRPARRTLNFPSPPNSAIDRIASLYGERDLAARVSSILDRYLVMLHRAIPKFSDREICVVIDALGDTWEPTPANVSEIPREVITAITSDRLDTKWTIDAEKFGARLDRTTFYERVTLGEITAAYWRMATTDSVPQDIISQIKKLLRPATTRTTPSSRPPRISAHLFEQASSQATGQPDPGQPNSDDADTGTGGASDQPDPDTDPDDTSPEAHRPDTGDDDDNHDTTGAEPEGEDITGDPTPDAVGVSEADTPDPDDDDPDTGHPSSTD